MSYNQTFLVYNQITQRLGCSVIHGKLESLSSLHGNETAHGWLLKSHNSTHPLSC